MQRKWLIFDFFQQKKLNCFYILVLQKCVITIFAFNLCNILGTLYYIGKINKKYLKVFKNEKFTQQNRTIFVFESPELSESLLAPTSLHERVCNSKLLKLANPKL